MLDPFRATEIAVGIVILVVSNYVAIKAAISVLRSDNKAIHSELTVMNKTLDQIKEEAKDASRHRSQLDKAIVRLDTIIHTHERRLSLVELRSSQGFKHLIGDDDHV